MECLKILLPLRSWEEKNHDGQTFIDIALHPNEPNDDTKDYVESELRQYLSGQNSNPDPCKTWIVLKCLHNYRSPAIETLLRLTGLAKVKMQALQLFSDVKIDELRPLHSRVSKKQMLHFAFVGNPGVGKLTS